MSSEAQQKAIAVNRSKAGRAFYRVFGMILRGIVFRFFRLRHRGAAHLETPGPLVLAPVHRSNLDAPLIGALSPVVVGGGVDTQGGGAADGFGAFGSNLVVTTTQIIPEPSRAMLLLLGAVGLLARRRRAA